MSARDFTHSRSPQKGRTHAKLLRIFLEESDKHKGKPFYEVIVRTAQQAGLARFGRILPRAGGDVRQPPRRSAIFSPFLGT